MCRRMSDVSVSRSQCFLRASDLSDDIREVYKAAGVLPIHVDSNRVKWICVGQDERRKRLVWSDFGGKKELIDLGHPEATALREFQEEAPMFFKSESLPTIEKDTFCVWNHSGKYVLYVVPVSALDCSVAPHEDAEKTAFAWIRMDDAFNAVFSSPMTLLEGRHSPNASVGVADLELFWFFATTLRIGGFRDHFT